MNTPAVLVRALAAALVVLAQPSASAGEASSPPASASRFTAIVYFADEPTEPASDAPPRTISVVPVDLPPELARGIPEGASGRFLLTVDASGRVRKFAFSGTMHHEALARPIRTALKKWVVEPVLCNGQVQEVKIPLHFHVLVERADPTDSPPRVHPPRALYVVQPAPPLALIRILSFRDRPNWTLIQGPGLALTYAPEGTAASGPPIARPVFARVPPMRVSSLRGVAGRPVPWLAGRVDLEFDISATGTPANVRIRGSTCSILEPDVIRAVEAWRYLPAREGDHPITTRMVEAVLFEAVSADVPTRFIQPVSTAAKSPSWKTAPRYARVVLPVYPSPLARARKQGEAEVLVHLSATGTLTEVAVEEATEPEFGLALREAVLASAFTPAATALEPVASEFRIQAFFTLQPEHMLLRDRRLPALVLLYEGREAPVPADKLDRQPALLNGRQPAFRPPSGPASAAPKVVVDIIIDPAGRVREPVIVSATPPELGHAVVQSCASWLFEAPTVRGRPVATRMRLRLGADTAPEQVTISKS